MHVPSVRDVVRVAFEPAILGMVTKVYIPVLFPLTFGIALGALKMDRFIGGLQLWPGFPRLFPEPTHLYVAAGTFVVGVLLWLVTYEQLVHKGKGSPSPVAGRTTELVVSGVYAYSRNPSIWGKLIGVLAVGIALNSATFCLVLVPALLAVSLIEKVVRQEPQNLQIFGDHYRQYREQVPLFVPWGLIFKSRKFQGFKD